MHAKICKHNKLGIFSLPSAEKCTNLIRIWSLCAQNQTQKFEVNRSFATNVSTRAETYEPRNEISNNVVCATSKASDQPANTRSLIRAFASRLDIL